MNRRHFLTSTAALTLGSGVVSGGDGRMTAHIYYTPEYAASIDFAGITKVLDGIQLVLGEFSERTSIEVRDEVDIDAGGARAAHGEWTPSTDPDVAVLLMRHMGEFAGVGEAGKAVLGPFGGRFLMYLAAHETGHALGYRHAHGDWSRQGGTVYFSTMTDHTEFHEPFGEATWTEHFP